MPAEKTKKYEPAKIEGKWQKAWNTQGLYTAPDKSTKPKYYALFEFPYPSGDGLHVGHLRPYTGMDVIARKRRMQGYNVLFPIGWDAFGLPAENYAVKTGVHPAITTKKNIATFTRQVKMMGYSFDWDREVTTTLPAYYKWTQWIFLQLFKHGLAYKARMPISWCPKCKIGLANEEVVNGKCERCGNGPVEKRDKEQWMLKITAYAEKLLNGLKDVDYLPQIKTQQINWIGKSEGSEIDFPLAGAKDKNDRITVFTTRPDTLFGSTYLVLAPEHPFVSVLKDRIKNWSAVQAYIKKALNKPEIERSAETKEKSGVPLEGIYAVNPTNGKKIPVWMADYVLGSYGTGAIQAVPAHDERDYAFAKQHNLPILSVVKSDPADQTFSVEISGEDTSVLANSLRALGKSQEYVTPTTKRYEVSAKQIPTALDLLKVAGVASAQVQKKLLESGGFVLLPGSRPSVQPLHVFVGEGVLTNSGKFSGLSTKEARSKVTAFVGGRKKVHYKLRDWLFSRQRYWGEPIPIIHCPTCGYVPVPESELPLVLPKVKDFKPRSDGISPLESATKWVNVKCPTCKGPAKRETDVMPNWAGSSWYFLRYVDPKNTKEFADYKKLQNWMPVDWYNGGAEHTTLHLLYSRFWNHFLYDHKLVPVAEPYRKRTMNGVVLAEDGKKMSKSVGNVVNPDAVVKSYGADTLRAYELFMGPFDQAIAWNSRSIEGVYKFLNRVWALAHEKRIDARVHNPALYQLINKTIKQVSEDIEEMGFNTVISALMIFVNEASRGDAIPLDVWKNFLLLLAPVAPHLAEELWAELPAAASKKKRGSVHLEPWPLADLDALKSDTITLVLQINGKVRDRVEVSADITEEQAKKMALESAKMKIFIGSATPQRIIYVPGRLVNVVV